MREEFYSADKSGELALCACYIETIPAHREYYGPVVRDAYLIECCTGGFGYIIINGTKFRFKEGDCYVLLPGDKVTHITTEESFRSEAFCSIVGNEMLRTVRRAGITSENPFLPKEAYTPILNAITDMVELQNDRTLAADYMRIGLIYKILASMLFGKNYTISSSTIQRAVGYIDLHYSEELSIDYIAKLVGLERSYFSVLFREHTGVTPHAYLNTVRINRACTLMRDTELSLNEIALNVGMEPTCFSRMFKREMGVTPSKYRQSLI